MNKQNTDSFIIDCIWISQCSKCNSYNGKKVSAVNNDSISEQLVTKRDKLDNYCIYCKSEDTLVHKDFMYFDQGYKFIMTKNIQFL